VTLRVGSLFSGIGGLDLGLEACGLGPVLWQVEHDPFCRSVLARHFPGATRAVHDVRLAGRSNLAHVDVIDGGFPCQPHSLAGRRKATEDERWLWPDFARIVGELGPRFVFLENVPGLLSSGHGGALAEVLGSLASLGYAAEWDCFRGSDVGAPHRRERWFLLAYADSGRCGPRGFDGMGVAVGSGGEDPVYATATPNASARELAHALRDGFERPDAGTERSGLRAARRGREQLADALRGAPQRGQPQRVRGGALPPGAGGGGEDRGAVGGDATGTAEPRVGRGPHGIPLGLDGPWPAGRGEPQHAWEPPRTAHKIPHRPARLKALGNAVIPAQAALAWRVLWSRMQTQIVRAA
jgi:DNA (cytosine-5)-methyltransferase 1